MRPSVLLLLLLTGSLSCEAKKPKVGAVCGADEEGTFVCADAKTGLICKASRRVALPCRGPKGCAGEKNPSCDTSLGQEGDACVEVSDFVGGTQRVCSEDKAALLACRDGKLSLDLRCRGPKGCDPTVMHLERTRDDACDRFLGEVGDACQTRGWQGESLGACSVDHKALLKCDKSERGKLVVSQVCDGPKGCSVGHLGGDPKIPMPVCDRGTVTEGKACGGGDEDACAADGSALLVCDRASAKVVKKPCGAKESCVSPKGMLARCAPK